MVPFLACFGSIQNLSFFYVSVSICLSKLLANITLTFTGLCKFNLIIFAHLPVEHISMSQMSPLKLALIDIHVGILSGMATDTRRKFGSAEGNRSFVIDFNRVRTSSRDLTASYTDVQTGLGASHPLCLLMTNKMWFSDKLCSPSART